MLYKHIRVNTLLNKITNKDILFGGNYTIDPYQNCEYGCIYCDSSNEKTIYIKTNAADVLRKELNQVNKGVIIIGSVNDPYQYAEENYRITRNLLEVIKEKNFPCHILTKSDLILRDVKLLSRLEYCSVTISLITLDNKISNIFEKNVPSPKIRLQTIEKLSESGIKSGIAVIPIIPYISESEIEKIIKSAKNHNAQYFLYKHLELKGDQKSCFLGILKEKYPNLIEKYKKLYKQNYIPNYKYLSKIKINCVIPKLLPSRK